MDKITDQDIANAVDKVFTAYGRNIRLPIDFLCITATYDLFTQYNLPIPKDDDELLTAVTPVVKLVKAYLWRSHYNNGKIAIHKGVFLRFEQK